MVTSNTTDPENTDLSSLDRETTAVGLPLASVFRRNCIEVIRPATGKSQAISLLVQSLAREERLNREHAESIIRQLIERERHASSAIGNGLAFPHLRTRDVSHFVGAIGVAPEGFNFGAMDSQTTKLVFLILTPWEKREEHTDLLSRLVKLVKDKAVNLQMNNPLRPQMVYAYLMDLGNQPPLGRSET
jgi:mannitol/fructose-specific phosphotransferase system IIA component (Ntr-type)